MIKEVKMIFHLHKIKCFLIIIICILVIMVSSILVMAEKADFTLRFGGSDPVGGLEDQSNVMFIKLVEERSNGKIKIDYFPTDQLGNEKEQIEGMQAGTQDFFSDPMNWYSEMVNDFRVLSYGYIFRSTEHLDKFLKNPIFEEIKVELIKKTGIRILAAGHRTPRVLFARKPILKLEDLKNMKMRCPPMESFVKLWEALGTKPVQIAWTESYLALRQGVADGIEASVAVCYMMKHHEVCPYLILTDHMMDTQHIAMREAAYQELPTELQKLLTEAAQDTMDWYSKESDKTEGEYIKKIIQEGGTVIQFNLEPWRERVGKTVPELESNGYWTKGLAEQINQIK